MARHGVISAGAQTPESLGPSWSLASPSLDAVCWSQERGENVVRPREARLNLWPYPTAGLCLRKPSLIACLIPSSIKVLAASGTLVPWVPSLDSWSKYSQVARASVIGRRSVSAMPNRIPWLGLELESFSTRKRVEIDSRFVKPAVAMLRTRKKGGRVGRPIRSRSDSAPSDGGWGEALCRQCFAECYSCRKSPNEAFRTKVTQSVEDSAYTAGLPRRLGVLGSPRVYRRGYFSNPVGAVETRAARNRPNLAERSPWYAAANVAGHRICPGGVLKNNQINQRLATLLRSTRAQGLNSCTTRGNLNEVEKLPVPGLLEI
jgi:hypothetical protein